MKCVMLLFSPTLLYEVMKQLLRRQQQLFFLVSSLFYCVTKRHIFIYISQFVAASVTHRQTKQLVVRDVI